MSKSPEELAAWRDGYLYGKRDGSEGRPQAPRGDAEGYACGYRWGVRHPVPPASDPRCYACGRQGRLIPDRGRRYCESCLFASMDSEAAEYVADAPVTVRAS